ncbi:hypothetical protein EW093_10175 [Thiospirochaeta perfilievii]|uniref:General secretion pathway protein GspK n=1 Tax=Thiospirochaeta perfilievii TaxID=252967 RepID=A0A5C1QDK3_9SPIO|nr:hypothetical protein [Thiospirochaeta perfilievii]QEN05059.1 hypothetical protein EW093_10175 [Thiospirochaeta perfilievii]
MSNSIKAFMFSITVGILAIGAAYSVSILNRSIDKSIDKLEILNSSIDNVKEVIDYLNKNLDVYKKIETIINNQVTIEFVDLSSKIDLNFVDFTIFKNRQFNKLLKQGFSWVDLEEYRNSVGFTTDMETYRDFFKDDIELETLFTTYSLPNINSMSDTMLELLYFQLSDNKSKANSLKLYIQNRRKSKKPIDSREFKRVISIYGDVLLNRVTIQPFWNELYLDKSLLEAVKSLSKESQKHYLGNKTTFWGVTILDKKQSFKTTLILRWIESENKYRLISIYRELV